MLPQSQPPSSPHLKVYRLTIAYDGFEYHGWQIQPNGISVQEVIEQSLAKLLKHPIRIIAAGRTDAGVHAIGQVAHFKTTESLDIHKTLNALNGMLPHDIRITDIARAAPRFHANRSATKKIYHYQVCLLAYVMPFERKYVYHFRKKVSIPLIQEAAKLFLGKHDFTAFANVGGSDSIKKNPYRTIFRLDVIPTPTGLRLEFEGDGFFYKMVRNITGMLLAIGCGKKTTADIMKAFSLKDRREAERAAPAHGLSLIKVFYPEELLNFDESLSTDSRSISSQKRIHDVDIQDIVDSIDDEDSSVLP